MSRAVAVAGASCGRSSVSASRSAGSGRAPARAAKTASPAGPATPSDVRSREACWTPRKSTAMKLRTNGGCCDCVIPTPLPSRSLGSADPQVRGTPSARGDPGAGLPVRRRGAGDGAHDGVVDGAERRGDPLGDVRVLDEVAALRPGDDAGGGLDD